MCAPSLYPFNLLLAWLSHALALSSSATPVLDLTWMCSSVITTVGETTSPSTAARPLSFLRSPIELRFGLQIADPSFFNMNRFPSGFRTHGYTPLETRPGFHEATVSLNSFIKLFPFGQSAALIVPVRPLAHQVSTVYLNSLHPRPCAPLPSPFPRLDGVLITVHPSTQVPASSRSRLLLVSKGPLSHCAAYVPGVRGIPQNTDETPFDDSLL
ncbi:hypothetical protein FB45DRAFT_223001 [Roridomyces roridus]|uniref:Secreted protein n=1 Tax=Roridomyces roridus TaxID=1738132 RepID=A0AAD7FFK3_9AGAR|nr:hypothetical protein FB45DRAFT_223001 [Roridomyces roridus]